MTDTATALPNRQDVPAHLTWDMSALYATPDDFYSDLEHASKLAGILSSSEMLTLTDSASIVKLLETYEEYLTIISKAGTYAGAQSAVDMTDSELQIRARDFDSRLAKMDSQTTTVMQTLKQADSDLIEQTITQHPKYQAFLTHLLSQKPYTLSLDVETALASLAPVLDLPYNNYEQCKLADMSFPDFEVEGQTYPMSFSAFENEYENDVRTDFRRTAFKAFSDTLRGSQHTIASDYLTQVKKEKIIADMRGYDSVFDYLLHDQQIPRAMYDDHIDTIMTHLAPPMRRYINLLKDVHGIEQMTFADLKVPLDPSFVAKVSIDDAKTYCTQALALLGDDYTDMVKRSFDERWYDFAQNKGKSTGGFCASPYGEHSYVLMSWTQNLGDVFTLIHEIGHAGHFYNAGKHQNYLSYEPSLYFIEAPSTCNELLLGHHLLQQQQDSDQSNTAFQRYVIASLLSNTYYHNFVTHYLEAHFQREVYRAVDAGKNLSTEDLHALKKATLQEFWGDAVHIDDDAALTWMRQPHYYMGLYPYTYSAGLSIATQVFKKLRAGEDIIDDWLNVLRAGGSKTPSELANMVGVDITDTATLIDSIDFISGLVDQAIELTDKLATA